MVNAFILIPMFLQSLPSPGAACESPASYLPTLGPLLFHNVVVQNQCHLFLQLINLFSLGDSRPV